MNTLKPLLITLLLIFSMNFAFSQQKAPSTIDSTKTYRIVKNDGTEFLGKILSQDAREVLLLSDKIGQVIIPKHEIREIIEVKAEDMSITGEYIPNEVFATRYFITTNGLPIEKGESYIQWNLFGPDVQIGRAHV